MTSPTTRIYVSVFLSRTKRKELSQQRKKEWPYDRGDDPSFSAAKQYRSPLTWGVCRRNVRNKIHEGDIVVFISCEVRDSRNLEYRLCAIATVKCKIRQTDVWKGGGTCRFSKYSNLLIRPSQSGAGWEHYEPPFKGPRGHNDWFWRIVKVRGLRKDDFKPFHKKVRFKLPVMIRRRSIDVACNYVVFSSAKSETYVLPEPPVVASYSKGQPREYWKRDRFSMEIKNRTLGEAYRLNAQRKWLRIGTAGHPYPHPPICFELSCRDAKLWRADFMELLRDTSGPVLPTGDFCSRHLEV